MVAIRESMARSVLSHTLDPYVWVKKSTIRVNYFRIIVKFSFSDYIIETNSTSMCSKAASETVE